MFQPINDANVVEVMEGQGQLCQVKFNVIFREHYLLGLG